VSNVSVIERERRRRGAGCVSNLTLDQALTGELGADQARALAAHLEGCRDCSAARAALMAEAERFDREAPYASLAADAMARATPERTAAWWRRRWLAPTLAMAAGLFIYAGARRADDGRPDPGVRTKGGFSLSTYVLHEGKAAGAMHMGEPVHPGDRLEFRYNGPRGYLAVVSVDQVGRVSAYYPPGSAAAPVEAGREQALTSAVELDATLGKEVIVGVRCDAALPVKDVMRAAADAAARARDRGGAPTDLGPLGLPCVESRHSIDKAVRPVE
jgi:hypothetical protein